MVAALDNRSMIRLLVGLGNPGPEYEATRHNAGFWFVDEAARKLGVTLSKDARTRSLGPSHARTRASLTHLGRLLLKRGTPCDAWEARALFERLDDAVYKANGSLFDACTASIALADALQRCGEVDAANRLRASTMEAIRRYTAAKVLGVSPSASPTVTASVPAGSRRGRSSSCSRSVTSSCESWLFSRSQDIARGAVGSR
jgi:hypothetical protein